jgi:hypothetical protein
LTTLAKEVSRVTNNSTGALPAALWRSRAGAFGLPISFPGTGVLGAGIGTGPCVTQVQSVPRVRDHVVFTVPATPKAAPAVPLGQPNSANYIYMTSVNAVGVGAAGPPPYREPV